MSDPTGLVADEAYATGLRDGRKEERNRLADLLTNAEPTWHRGMYGSRDDMFTRDAVLALLTAPPP